MNNILSLINPARIIKVEDAEKIAAELHKLSFGVYGAYAKNPRTNDLATHVEAYSYWLTVANLLQSFESLYDLKLEKGHFVCPPEPLLDRVMDAGGDMSAFRYEHDNWRGQQAKVIFEGFEKHSPHGVINKSLGLIIVFDREYGVYASLFLPIKNPVTIGDLLTEIERYDRTAAQKIELKYTSNIFKILKIEG